MFPFSETEVNLMQTKLCRTALIAMLSLTLAAPLASAASDSESDNAQPEENSGDTTSADDWFASDKETAAIQSETMEKTDERKKKEQERYAYLLTDSGYDYFLDGRATRWIQIPYRDDEYIVDTWIKLVPTDSSDDPESGNYSYPQKYYLAHYYVRPKTQQIQFLSELEVSGGRPDNTVQGRGYQPRNWENLTPGSIEDEVYRGTLASIKKHSDKWSKIFGSSYTGPRRLRDFIEEYLRISI